ncbi:TonB-dependent receptor plug domain-containing protein [Tenacibaculum maritimum]|uniref:TonB-dependent receptor plug domain-containing protein n=1 Tax=Tenacibaculum maritimum TaxID=107401 RepID=UPI0012E60D85|nr:TonB-dependent receptor [Tenacibaculum maritimum]MCD9582691.1 TonB-dependent receptor [Tenacibaculum maritimum]MCD9635878.1 TonB-dependent receptor [Tenacibaculum maritimum]CAA0169985.1 TonB-dependent outer membrane receptor precursor involved in hemin utilization, HmuR-family [Tenacibaculum maritimum]CAA0218102.1 TonB-dependent outer membrane receptor precursor involved in hemin utilization, HmuR-family [Tenacibaculum maritimum]
MFLNKQLFYVFGLITTVAFAQGAEEEVVQDNQLEEVVVTATRTKRRLGAVPMPVTLVSKKQLQQSGTVRLRDILLEQTGIVMVSDFGNSEGVQIQGVAADYTLILIDGVPIVGRAAGNIDLRRLTVNNIKQIEIVKGPSSSLYGSEAIGGVINIITEQPKVNQFKGNLQMFARGGAKNELDINTNVITKSEKFGVVAGINLNSSNGFDLSPETKQAKTMHPHQNFTGNLQLSYDFSDKMKTIVSSRLYEQEQHVFSVKNSETDWNIDTRISYAFSAEWSMDYTLYATRFKTEGFFDGKKSIFDRGLLRPEIRTRFTVGKGDLIAGVGANFDELERSEFEGKKKYEAQYIFGQYDVDLVKKMNIVLGARFDSHNKYKSAFSPKLSINYELNDNFSIKSSVGYGFKAPDFRQLYFNFRNSSVGYIVLGTQTLHDVYVGVSGVENIEKELKPENSVGYNLGFQLKPVSKLKIGINLFRNDIKDLIETFDTGLKPADLGLSDGTRTFSYKNIASVYTQGVELDLNYRISNNLRILAGYQFLDTGDKQEEKLIEEDGLFVKDANGVSFKVEKEAYFGLVNRSRHTANVKLFYENFDQDLRANLRAIYRSKYAVIDTNDSQGIIDDYDNFVSENIQVNMAVEKTFFNLMSVQIGVDNLLDERGEENKVNFKNNDNVLRLGRSYYGRVTFKI